MKTVINGCFDLINKGHINLIHLGLKYAQSGTLLVLINSDKSVREMKGTHRPYDDVVTRGSNIEKIIHKWCQKNRDYLRTKVEIFGTEKELEKKLERFQPDMIIRGHDRPVEEITGYGKWPILIVPRTVDENGIEVSTTRTAQERGKE